MEEIVIAGVFSDLKSVKTRSVVQMVVEIPIEQAERVVSLFGFPQPGAEIAVAVARLDPEKVKASPAPQETPKKRFHELPLSQQAALRCGDVEFQGFLSAKYPADWEMLKQSAGTRDTTATMAAALIRRCCGGIGGLLSRRELDTDEGAANRWKSLNAEYEQHAGLAPQAR